MAHVSHMLHIACRMLHAMGRTSSTGDNNAACVVERANQSADQFTRRTGDVYMQHAILHRKQHARSMICNMPRNIACNMPCSMTCNLQDGSQHGNMACNVTCSMT